MNRLVGSAFVAVVSRLQALKTGTSPGIDWPVASSGLLLCGLQIGDRRTHYENQTRRWFA
ncbi:MAG: hypothetical protein DMG89_23910 [Acidobacteria bacterium]|nr:MAG: hypothetical protein DMG89_23910 [Acidobacteriota bacterium]